MLDIGPYLDTLTAQAHVDGGWGYAPGQAAHLEPTCLGLLALSLRPERHPTVLARAREALARCGRPDGTYRLERGREEAVWPTALALFVQTTLGGADELRRKTA